jgi:hypothetical protein
MQYTWDAKRRLTAVEEERTAAEVGQACAAACAVRRRLARCIDALL